MRVLKSSHFRCDLRVPLWSWDRMEPHGAKNHCQRWPETGVSTTASHTPYIAMDDGDRAACLKIRVLKSGHFRRDLRVPLWSWDRMEPHGDKNHYQRWPQTCVSTTACHTSYIAMDDKDRAAKRLGTSTSATSEANKLARVLGWATIAMDREWCRGLP